MKAGLLAGLILCISFAPYLRANSLMKPSEIPESVLMEVREAVFSFQRPDIKGAEKIREKSQKAVKNRLGIKTVKREVKPVSILYFFSFSLPESSILRTIDEAHTLSEKGIASARMILRGFPENSLKETFRICYSLLNQTDSPLPFEIDPELFRSYSVYEVPTIVISDGENAVSYTHLTLPTKA